MKKYRKIIFLIQACVLLCLPAKAQYTKLLDFNAATTGTSPYGSVVLSATDSVLYGLKIWGGPNGNGTVFSINTNGTGYTNLNTTIVSAYGSVMRSGNVLYGMTSAGGADGGGTIFSINTNGTGFTVLHDFITTVDSLTLDSIDGRNPNGSLIISGNVLYGMTYYGGTNNMGTVFSVNTNGSGYTKLFDFNGSNGRYPMGDLTLSGNKLYGMTLYGGANGIGVMFSINTDGTGYNNILDFNGLNGNQPMSSLTVSGNVLYGVSNGGGLYNHGLVFSIHTDGSQFIDLFDFNVVNGENPMGSLIISGSKLYGTTGQGGVNGYGTVFSIDTNGVGFQKLFDFNGINGKQPRSRLTLSGNTLYGTTVIGGTNDQGVVFSLNAQSAVSPEICMVTADSSLSYDYNTVYWNNSNYADVDSFIIYRYDAVSTQYLRIGAVDNTISKFTDTAFNIGGPNGGNPRFASWKYKLAIRYTSGTISQKSPYHETMFMQQTGGNFSWNPYTVESGQINPVSAYSFLRDDNNTGSWHVLVNVSGSSVTDPDYVSYPNGNWRIDALGFNCSASTLRSHSNTAKLVPANINEPQAGQALIIWPNPVSEILNITFDQIQNDVEIRLFNALGENVIHKSESVNSAVDVSDLPSGIYFLQIQSADKVVSKKIVVQH